MVVVRLVKLSFLLATIIGFGFNFEALISNGDINWLGWLITYAVCFSFFYFYLFKLESSSEEQNIEPAVSINPAHLEALYKQAMIVERNAQKANLVFSQQLEYVKKILHKAKHLDPNEDFNVTHESLIKELDILEHHLERLLGEMKKNVKLGEKLQQSVANIDPEIGVI